MVKYIVIGMIIGGMLGWALELTYLTGIITGAVAGGIIYLLYAKWTHERIDKTTESGEQKMLLREEQLDITKERVQTGEVKVRKEVVEEQKTFTVPIKREEMVIEAGDEEAYRIPLKEEEVQITKSPVKVNEVSVSKREVEEIEQVKGMVKKETAEMEISGDADVKEKGNHL